MVFLIQENEFSCPSPQNFYECTLVRGFLFFLIFFSFSFISTKEYFVIIQSLFDHYLYSACFITLLLRNIFFVLIFSFLNQSGLFVLIKKRIFNFSCNNSLYTLWINLPNFVPFFFFNTLSINFSRELFYSSIHHSFSSIFYPISFFTFF